MEMTGEVRRMHRRDKRSVRDIARMTGLSRNTVAKWPADSGRATAEASHRTSQPTKLTPYHEAINQTLAADAGRPKRERRTALALHEELKAAGCEGSYSRLTDFIRQWRQGADQGPSRTA